MPRLRRVDHSLPGITRRRAGRGFYYLDLEGARLTDPEVLDRIRALAIPPAWSGVWICPYANGHIQAVGTDARGRLQYRYHDHWRLQRDRAKFEHMLDFARALPDLRVTCEEALDQEGLGRTRVLACAVRLLDLGFFRIGTEGYAEENQTYGLATMEKRHVSVDGDRVTFDYVAKAGKRRLQTVVDPVVAEVVAGLRARRGGSPRLLMAKEGRRWREVSSADINAFIKDTTGGDFTAKDFRTWSATVLAAVALAVSVEAPGSRRARQRVVARAMKEVAHYLGNTPAVTRSSYVDPRIVDRYMHGATIANVLGQIGAGDLPLATQGTVEAAVLDLLADGGEAAVAA
ncbi:MAG TPA: hypothetical protein VFH45_06910 [Acidimicrobiales bacterium]|nr:hypothetical protein [Acidimicrobiales bacterium]